MAWLVIWRKRTLFVVDEVSQLCSPNGWTVDPIYWRQHPSDTPALDHIVNYGRHVPMAMVCTSRRPASIHRDITANSKEIDCFVSAEPNDAFYFEKFIGKDAASRLQTMPKWSYLAYSEGQPPEIRKSKKA
jgi:hypothetical protein